MEMTWGAGAVGVAGLLALLGGCARGSGGAALTHVSAVAAGTAHTCALLSASSAPGGGGGTVQCWGWNGYFQIGVRAGGNISPIPIRIPGLTTVTAISTRGEHTCALLSDSTVRCWGRNTFGQLGDGSTMGSATPVVVSALERVTAVAAGVLHTCALLAGGTVTCWGKNHVGQLGTGTSGDPSFTPVAARGITTATAISAGLNDTCALLADRTVSCWGANDTGQLGTGTISRSPTPTPLRVAGLTSVTAIVAGMFHACATLEDRTVQCWGDNGYGQLGTGTISLSPTPTPVRVAGLTDVRAVAARGEYTCALLSASGGDSTVRCWGRNTAGQLGTGTTDITPLPTQVAGLTTAVAVVAGDSHTCALLSDRTVRCWGRNIEGQLGTGASSRSPTPWPVMVRSPH